MARAIPSRSDIAANASVALAGVFWGIFWLPMRAFDQAGLAGGWASLWLYLISAALLLPIAFVRRRRLGDAGVVLLVTGFFTGAGFTFYATSLLLTEVVRTLLLFYMTPVWSTLLGRALLQERITGGRGLAIVLGIAGLAVILGADGGAPYPRNLGDWLALLAGLAWAYGTVRIRREQDTAAFEQVFAFFIGGLVVSAAVVLLPAELIGFSPSGHVLRSLAPWLLVLVVAFVVPSVFMVIWGATLLSPGRVGILLMGEVVVGIASAAVLTDEPFGAREAVGAVLIVSAGLIEVLTQPLRAGRG